SIDTASAGSAFGNSANALISGQDQNANRGPSDFDIRHSFSTAITYSLPRSNINGLFDRLLNGWSVQSVLQARSAAPANLYYNSVRQLLSSYTLVRPDLTPGMQLYIYDPRYPGGKMFNNTIDPNRPGCLGPFCPPPTDSMGVPTRQGSLGRNALRGF